MLREAGIAEEDFAIFDRWDGKFTEKQANLVAKLLFRLRWLESLEIDASEGSTAAGALVSIEGTAISHSHIQLPALASAAIERTELSLTIVRRDRGERLALLSKDLPKAWSERGHALEEPVAFIGVALGSTEVGGLTVPLLLTARPEWRPTTHVPAGTAWLVQQGFDAALLDDVRHGQQFARQSESHEARAFYECISIMARGDGQALGRIVRHMLPETAKQAEAVATEAERKLVALSSAKPAANQAARDELSRELRDTRRRQAVAAGVAAQAKLGRSSVAPFFLEPEQHTGEAVALEGTARRAVRIAVDGVSDRPGFPPLREYYELDLFTKDSQHLPVICCVPGLPEGFPTGEVIREPVRVTGVFFKKWTYARRTTDEPATRTRVLPARLQSPLIIAATPEWLPATPPTSDEFRGLLGGIGFIATLLIVWVFVAGASRRDRIARWRRARYDSPLDKIAGP